MDISISVAGKIATVADSSSIVCGNSDYRLVFTFDAEWQNEIVKTCRFITAPGVYTDVVFSGLICAVPVIVSGDNLFVGVYAGALRTTTPAAIRLIESITSDDGTPVPVSPDAYAQMMVLVNQAVSDAEQSVIDANSALADAALVLDSFEANLGEGHILKEDLQTAIATGSPLLVGLELDIPIAQEVLEDLADPVLGAIPAAQEVLEDLADPMLGAIPAAQAAHTALVDPVTGSIKLAQNAKSALDGSISTGEELKDDLDASIVTGQGVQNDLATPVTGSIAVAQAAHTALVDPSTGSIKLANDAEDALEADITAAGVAEASLEQAIADGSLETIRENVAEAEQDIKSLENVVLQMNPANDAKVTVTSYEGVNSLPKNAAQAPLSVIQGGMTAKNEVSNGDFSNGTTGWTGTNATLTVVNGRLRVLLSTTNYGYAVQTINFIAGHVYHFKVKGYIGDSNAWRFGVYSSGGSALVNSGNLTVSGSFSVLYTALVNDTVTVRLYCDTTTDNVYSEFDDVQITNLTTIAQQALTLTQADAMLIDYYNGTQSAVSGRVRSVGKNLFDGQLEQGGITSAGVNEINAARLRSKYILVRLC